MKVAVTYRVLQGWRLPMFERLSDKNNIDLKLFYGCDFKGTKVVSSKRSHTFLSKKLPSIPIRLKTSNGNALAPFSPTLLFELILYRPDVVLCEGASNFINNLFVLLYVKLFNKKMIQWGLGEISGRKKSRIRKSLDFIIEYTERKSDACLAYSNVGADYYKNIGVSSDKIFVAVNVIDTDDKLKEISKFNIEKVYKKSHAKSKFNVLFVGALTRQKNVELLINAYQKLEIKYGHDVSLVVVGNGDDAIRLKEIAVRSCCENIAFRGNIVEGVSKYFLSSDIVVLPGLGGLVVSDSLVHGVPVIASIGDGCEQDLLSTGAGIIINDITSDKLFEVLDELFQSPDRMRLMSSEAKNVIENKYNVNTYIDSIVECLESVDK
ncbi:hypothetical protein SIN8267_03458 [Sinobacterium norvegicum]|uniref:Glycosyl transferase family 1 domain-containing protein n=1 Tax=Sinobacterium norvegicum TaxID=1641715 RepID=A0ABM9AJA0_9GAMM|nr:glycosyltransferase family 4 protein [Sinobacterium norvegicum]CAH0993310.1 hypothetical protein SIN8267_03458 [Sinobacterium norvegicum]